VRLPAPRTGVRREAEAVVQYPAAAEAQRRSLCASIPLLVQQGHSSKRVALTALAIFAVAFAIRIIHLWQIRSAPFFALLMGDSRSYDEWARRIASGEWFGREVFYQAPLYPYFLAVLYKTIGRDLLAVRIAQSAIGAASCVLLFLAGRRLFSYRVGVVAGCGLAFWAPAIFFDALIQKSVLDVFLVSLLLWLLPEAATAAGQPGPTAGSAGVKRWLAIGATLGVLALTRENALVFIIVIAIGALVVPGGIRNAASLACGVAMVLLPVALRNASVPNGGFFVTTSQFGPNFYIGNHHGADGTYAPLRFGRGAPEYERQDATELAERAIGRPLSAGDVSTYWTDQAVTFITSEPGAWLSLTARKFRLLWNATEMVDTEAQESHAEYSWPLRTLGPVMHFGLLVPLAVLGVIINWRRGAAVRMLVALTVAYAASVLLFYVFARYRYPLVPLLILFAAAALVELATGRTRPRAATLAVVVVVVVFCNWPVVPPGWMLAVSENNIGVALQAEGRYDDAATHYQRAAALRPDYAPAINNLGTALRAAGRLDAAVSAYERALAAHPDFPEAHYNLANALSDAGRGREAVHHFEIALAALPGSADVHNNLGVALASDGRLDDAIAQFREAVRGEPGSAKAHRNLGESLLERGAVNDGVDELRRAAALAPDDGQLRYDIGSALLEAGRPDEAATELREAVQRLPQSAEARNNLGIALGTLNRFDEAIAQFRDALRLNPAFADARRNLEMAMAARHRSP
jgi:tetratricopeptide (TPR) repeat protein